MENSEYENALSQAISENIQEKTEKEELAEKIERLIGSLILDVVFATFSLAGAIILIASFFASNGGDAIKIVFTVLGAAAFVFSTSEAVGVRRSILKSLSEMKADKLISSE